jgi:regulatory protein YycH of two-component signal transduction system YycFG
MNFERAKSIILMILIATSSYLTWSIWTYEPKYEKIDQSKYINVESDEQMVSDIIKPNKILIHRYNQHFQASAPTDIEKAEKQMSQWKLYNLTRNASQMTQKQFEDFAHADGTVEIKFSDDIPLDLYKTILDTNNEEVPTFSFDRIIYKQKDVQAQNTVIYFASSENLNLLEATVETTNLQDFNYTFYQNASVYPEYLAYSVNGQHQVFVPKSSVTLNGHKYYIGYLSISNFKDALFNDPLNVRREDVVSGEEYTDSTRLMSVNRDTYMISYINPSQKSTVLSSSSDLLAKSIQFINNHAGWKGRKFRFASMNDNNQSVNFPFI